MKIMAYSRWLLLSLLVIVATINSNGMAAEEENLTTCSVNEMGESSCQANSTTDEDMAALKKATENCKDDKDKCETWASQGECKENPKYMLKNCRLSCMVCSDQV